MRDKHHPTGRKSLFFATLAHHPHLHPGQAAGLGRGGGTILEALGSPVTSGLL